MRKIIFSAIVCMMPLIAQSQSIDIPDVVIGTDEATQIDLKLQGASSYSAVGLTVELPQGIQFDNLGGDPFVMASDIADNHVLRWNSTKDNAVKVVVTSETNTAFTDDQGTLLQIGLRAGSSPGRYEARLTGIELSATDNTPQRLNSRSFYVYVMDPTGITTMEQPDDTGGYNDFIYNLQGQRVQHLSPGIYVKRGKKFVVR